MQASKIRAQVLLNLRSLMLGSSVAGHNLDHFLAVQDHALKALNHEKISDRQKLQVELAALLHDADDKKLFSKSHNYGNARRILDDVEIENAVEFVEGIVHMIDLVSCSKNGDSFNTETDELWMLIPRDSDRLEAIGAIGIRRCYEFTLHKKAPLHLDSTIHATTSDAVMEAATPERFEAYMQGEPSASMIDHYYDKLLHIGQPARLRSQNPYILEEAKVRHQDMVRYVIDYWTTMAISPQIEA
jgi:uncharacterized protein